MVFVFLIIIFVYVIISYYTNYKISTANYKLKTPLLIEQSSIKIVIVSDLHSGIHGKKQNTLINKIKYSEPDLIVLVGDIFDDFISLDGGKLLLSGISGFAPIYYVTGNHERWSNDIKNIQEILLSYGVTILSDTYIKIEINNNKIILAGIEDPAGKGNSNKKLYEIPNYDQDESMEKAFGELDNILFYKILLAHRPEKIEMYKKYSFDLVLSGHSHGGQFRIPCILNGVYAPNQGIFPKYAGGVYTHEKLIHIISRGLSIKFKLPRIFNPPELVIVTIESDI